ncbi:MAG: winged helix-turn-helix domain-containing protein [Burkholderiales bacterium]|nr:winged helix-turn-helix domain-containing protein [Burkholderiales bacterium]
MTLEAGFRIGACDVLPLEGRIVTAAGSLRIEPKAMAVLLELARHAPAPRTRHQIEQAVWPRCVVSDDALTRCIGQIRRALGDDAQSPRHLETLPRRGYRLRSAPGERSAGAARAEVESLIVLPIRQLTPSADDCLGDGLTELLILRLCALRGLRVVSRTTAMSFKARPASIAEIAAATGVQWVVEGSVLQSGDRLQVVAQLIDARTDAHVWAADYRLDVGELLPLQNEIASRLAAAIGVELRAESGAGAKAQPTLAPQVMRDYLRGRQLIALRTLASLAEAARLFEGVAAAAAGFAPAWASLAECEMLLAHYGAPDVPRLVARSQRHAERALAIEPASAIALSARAALRFFFLGDPDGAAADTQLALAHSPSHALAMVTAANVCAQRRDFAQATQWMEAALLVDPLDVGMNMNFGDHMILQRRYGDAVRAFERALEIAPGHRPSLLRASWAHALAGAREQAQALLARIAPAEGGDAAWLEYAALAAAAAGDRQLAAQHFEALERLAAERPVAPWALARAAAAAGRLEAAIVWIEAAARAHSSSLPFALLTPAFDALHGEARFLAVAGRSPVRATAPPAAPAPAS